MTDLRYTASNLRALQRLLDGVDLLSIEVVFLDADADHAARRNHLTARQAGTIARQIGARRVVPFHFSPRYEGRAGDLSAEVHAAWSGALPPPPQASDCECVVVVVRRRRCGRLTLRHLVVVLSGERTNPQSIGDRMKTLKFLLAIAVVGVSLSASAASAICMAAMKNVDAAMKTARPT